MQPYLPDSARSAMPHSAFQPLPAYLRPEFQQFLDRARPHEPVRPVVKGKVQPFDKGHCLTYRYLDTGETVLVPNIWYNHTLEMRIAHWEWLAADTAAKHHRVKTRLAQMQESPSPLLSTKDQERAAMQLRWHLDACAEVAEAVQKTLEDVRAGVRFV